MITFNETKAIIDKMPEARKELATALYEKCLFQHTQLDKLQQIIAEQGWTEAYQNGANQSGRKKTGEGDLYIALTKVFNATVKQLSDIIKDTGADEASDELITWLRENKRI